MSAVKRESLLSRRQWVSIWVIVGLMTLWIAAYVVLRMRESRSDPDLLWLLSIQFDPPADRQFSGRYVPDFPNRTLVRKRSVSGISVPQRVLPWSVVFHPLQQAEFLITGRRVYFIAEETNRDESGGIYIGRTAKF